MRQIGVPLKTNHTNFDYTRKCRGIATGGQWMYLWYLMGTKAQIEKLFLIDFMMIGMKRTDFCKVQFKKAPELLV